MTSEILKSPSRLEPHDADYGFTGPMRRLMHMVGIFGHLCTNSGDSVRLLVLRYSHCNMLFVSHMHVHKICRATWSAMVD